MAPMTSFARRDSVGTDTGGRMATSGLLQIAVWPPATSGTSRQRVSQRVVPDDPVSAGPWSFPGPQLSEGLERVVEVGDPGEGEPAIGGGQRVGAVAGGHEE